MARRSQRPRAAVPFGREAYGKKSPGCHLRRERFISGYMGYLAIHHIDVAMYIVDVAVTGFTLARGHDIERTQIHAKAQVAGKQGEFPAPGRVARRVSSELGGTSQ
jgi:hypothetical protein